MMYEKFLFYLLWDTLRIKYFLTSFIAITHAKRKQSSSGRKLITFSAPTALDCLPVTAVLAQMKGRGGLLVADAIREPGPSALTPSVLRSTN